MLSTKSIQRILSTVACGLTVGSVIIGLERPAQACTPIKCQSSCAVQNCIEQIEASNPNQYASCSCNSQGVGVCQALNCG